MASINIRQKGADGERQVAKLLNAIIHAVVVELGYPADQQAKALSMVQRNQNQSAVGGKDLVNTMGLSFEVKRQEQLSVNTWWRQCTEAAARNGEHPVLIWRQNRERKWRIRTIGWVALSNPQRFKSMPVELTEDDFKSWFREWVRLYLEQGGSLEV